MLPFCNYNLRIPNFLHEPEAHLKPCGDTPVEEHRSKSKWNKTMRNGCVHPLLWHCLPYLSYMPGTCTTVSLKHCANVQTADSTKGFYNLHESTTKLYNTIISLDRLKTNPPKGKTLSRRDFKSRVQTTVVPRELARCNFITVMRKS
jgi:hypothetical protein